MNPINAGLALPAFGDFPPGFSGFGEIFLLGMELKFQQEFSHSRDLWGGKGSQEMPGSEIPRT